MSEAKRRRSRERDAATVVTIALDTLKEDEPSNIVPETGASLGIPSEGTLEEELDLEEWKDASSSAFGILQKLEEQEKHSSMEMEEGEKTRIALTPEQKRANHIASEQRRRGAIKGAYEAIAECIPSLKDAILTYESRNSRNSEAIGEGDTRGNADMSGLFLDGVRIDGRAGPKSEAVMLAKSVKHIRTQLKTRQNLLGELADLHKKAESAGIDLGASNPVWDHTWENGPKPSEPNDKEETSLLDKDQ